MDANISESRSPLRVLAIRLFRILLVVYASLLAMLVMFESKLIYQVPQRSTVDNVPDGVESVRFASADGTKIHCWFLQRQSARQALIYFHGNAEDVDSCWDEMADLAESLRLAHSCSTIGATDCRKGNRTRPGLSPMELPPWNGFHRKLDWLRIDYSCRSFAGNRCRGPGCRRSSASGPGDAKRFYRSLMWRPASTRYCLSAG